MHIVRSSLAGPALRLAVLAACAFVAIALAHEVHEGQPIAADRAIMEAVHRSATPALDAIALALTFLGNPVPMTVITVAGAAALAACGRRREAIALVIGVVGASLLDAGLKELFDRVRPNLWPRAPVPGDSFPSGHALTSTVALGALAAFAGRIFPRYALAFTIAAGVLIAGIAYSRVYLGVHWPTDVVAGIAIGYVYLVILLLATDRRLPFQRGRDAS